MSAVVVCDEYTGMTQTEGKYQSKDEMVSMDASTCQNTDDMVSNQGVLEAI